MMRKINAVRTLAVLFLLITNFISCDQAKEKVSPLPFGGLAVTATLSSLPSSAQMPSIATGSLVGHFDKSTYILDFTVDWSNLSSVPIRMQLQLGAETPISITGFSSSRNGTLYSSVSLPGNAADNLLSGNFQFSIATVFHPEGEIKGQIIAK